MKVSFITMSGTTQPKDIADRSVNADKVVNYYDLIDTGHQILQRCSKKYRLRIYNEGEEEALTPFSKIILSDDSINNFFVLEELLKDSDTTPNLKSLTDLLDYSMLASSAKPVIVTYREVKDLIESGIDVNGDGNNLLLWYILEFYSISFLKLIISYGFNVTKCNIDKYWEKMSYDKKEVILSASFNFGTSRLSYK